MNFIDADAFAREMSDRIGEAIKWQVNAIADRNKEIEIRAEQAIATFCEASLTAKKMPTIDAEFVKHGHWEFIGGYGYQYRCSNCIRCAEHRTNYCPNCGAKMDMDEVNDDN